MSILYFKAFHIIGFIAWFAGIFYLPRLFVYHLQAMENKTEEGIPTFELQERRLQNIITLPAMLITWICGLCMLYLYGWEWLANQTWMHVKLLLLFLTSAYTLLNSLWLRKLRKGIMPMRSSSMRLYNEIPSLLMIFIVLLAVLKHEFNMLIGVVAFLALGGILFIAARIYRRSLDR